MTIEWKMVQRMEELSDLIESMEEYLDQVYETHKSYNTWIQQATENILELTKEVKYLKNKKACI